MRVLLVLAEPPLQEGGAEGRCALGMIKGLRTHGIDVRVLAARQIFSVAGEPPADIDAELVKVDPPPPGWRTRLARLTHPRGELGRGPFAARVHAMARDVDVLHLMGIDTAWCAAPRRCPSLLQINFLVGEDRGWTPAWSQEFRERIELRLAERAAVARHRWLTANSPEVAAHLRARTRGTVIVAPLCLDPQYYAPTPTPTPTPTDGAPVAGIIGTATWQPTGAAMRRLVDRVWPRVHRAFPDARLRLAGRGVSAMFANTRAPGIEIVGAVDSGISFIRGLSVMVNPLERGSGMKVKALESLALGVPIVTTRAGAEGLAQSDGVVIEQDDQRLADRLVELLRDPRGLQQRGSEARLTFDRHYSPVVATEPLVDAYRRMAAER